MYFTTTYTCWLQFSLFNDFFFLDPETKKMQLCVFSLSLVTVSTRIKSFHPRGPCLKMWFWGTFLSKSLSVIRSLRLGSSLPDDETRFSHLYPQSHYFALKLGFLPHNSHITASLSALKGPLTAQDNDWRLSTILQRRSMVSPHCPHLVVNHFLVHGNGF